VEYVKVGLIGGGGIADDHIRGYRQFADRIGVTAVADSQPDTLARRSGELGATGFADYGRLIAEGDIDAVDICLPHHLHRDAIVRAAEKGKHILCE
jgi:predicted dehydrogenase